MSTVTDERALVAAAQAGDERAFRALVEPYRVTLEVHCYRMLGSLHDAEDVAQETLLRAWRSLGRFERRASLTTWLYRIATNACLDELERRPRRPEPVVDPYPDARLHGVPDEELADPAARYAAKEGLQLAFLTAIQRLPGRQRAVLVLRDVLGWTAAETADLLETTVAGANSALQRARATIEAEAPAHAVAPGRATQRALLDRYVDALERADVDALVALLREDAVLTMPPGRTVVGAAAIAAFLAARHGEGHCALVGAAEANRGPALVMGTGGVERVLVLDVRGDRIAALHAYEDPSVLAAFAARSPSSRATSSTRGTASRVVR